MILADTSIWIDHFRTGNPKLQNLLNQGQIVAHPFVVAELALGNLKDRARTLSLLDLLPQARGAQLHEVRAMIETHRLYDMGIGLTDAYLLASVLINRPMLLWTRDKALRRVAEALQIHATLA